MYNKRSDHEQANAARQVKRETVELNRWRPARNKERGVSPRHGTFLEILIKISEMSQRDQYPVAITLRRVTGRAVVTESLAYQP